MPEIAMRFGVSKQAVHKALSDAGVEARPREEARAMVLERQYPQSFREQALKRCEQIGITAAAAELHVSRQTLKSWGAKGRPRRRPLISWVDIKKMYLDGQSPYEIAPVAGIHPNVIAAKLRAGGVKMRSRSEATKLAAAKRRVESAEEVQAS
jgi:hypothetical protein